MVLAAALSVGAACATTPPLAQGQPGPRSPSCTSGVSLLGFSDALDKTMFRASTVGGLSALTYDAVRDVYYALVDNQGASAARFYTLSLPLTSEGLGTPRVLEVTELRDSAGQPFTGTDFDGEGIALLRQGELAIASETEPSLRRFSLDGRFLGDVPVPGRFKVTPAGDALGNAAFEGLTVSPTGLVLTAAMEGPLKTDGQTPDGRYRIRLLRYENREPDGLHLAAQHFYLSEPGQGVAELAAVSDDELLVLERSFAAGLGNTVRLFSVSLSGAADVSSQESLQSATSDQALAKRLLLDLSDCPSSGAQNRAPQKNPLLDNFEGAALGPASPTGQALLLVSDDNFNPTQITRVVALQLGR